jgi:hypothetical protein
MLVISTSLFSQQPVLTKEEYLKKSKSQKTAAWVLAGGGAALVIIGLVAYTDAENPNNPFEIFDTSDLVFTLLGGAALVGSKILFRASDKNKNRATSISFKNERIQTMQNGSYANKYVPAIRLSIPL